MIRQPLTWTKGTRLQRREPKCQDPVKAVRGVTGAAREQMMTSASAMLQMYMLDLVCSTRLLGRIVIHVPSSHSYSYLRTVKITRMFPPIPMVIIRP